MVVELRKSQHMAIHVSTAWMRCADSTAHVVMQEHSLHHSKPEDHNDYDDNLA